MRAEEMPPEILPPMPDRTEDCVYLQWRVGDTWTDPERWDWVSYDINGWRWFCSCQRGGNGHVSGGWLWSAQVRTCEHLAHVQRQLLEECGRGWWQVR